MPNTTTKWSLTAMAFGALLLTGSSAQAGHPTPHGKPARVTVVKPKVNVNVKVNQNVRVGPSVYPAYNPYAYPTGPAVQVGRNFASWNNGPFLNPTLPAVQQFNIY